MKELRAAGMAYHRIAATLNREGVPTRTPGERWHGFAINQILKRSEGKKRNVNDGLKSGWR
jgi:hypothetical protein